LERQVVTGQFDDKILGVNSVSIDGLEAMGVALAKWRGDADTERSRKCESEDYRFGREDVLDLRMGEVVRVPNGYLTVAKVDLERQVVTGQFDDKILGVNSASIDKLEMLGRDIAKWV